MGLDIVEMIMEVEERFGIEVPDDDVATMKTAGDLHRYVMAKWGVRDGKGRVCPRLIALAALRRFLRSRPDLTNRRVTTTCELEELFPVSRRIEDWKALSSASNLRLPLLGVHFFFRTILQAAMVYFLVFVGLPLFFLRDHLVAMPDLLLMGLLIAGFFLFLAIWYHYSADKLPARLKTVGDLIEALVLLNPEELRQRGAAVQADEVWGIIRDILHTSTGISVDGISPDSKLIEDLRLG